MSALPLFNSLLKSRRITLYRMAKSKEYMKAKEITCSPSLFESSSTEWKKKNDEEVDKPMRIC